MVSDEATYTYQEMSDRVLRAAAVLRERGLGPGHGVAVLAPNSAAAVTVLLAAVMTGCRYTGLHPLGGTDSHAAVIADAQVRLVIADTGRFPGLASGLDGTVPLLSLDELAEEAARAEPAAPRSLPEPGGEDIAFLPYTGGTTGQPKGVMLPHRSVVTNALLTLGAWQWPAQIRLLVTTPITHAAALLLIPALLRRGTIVLRPGFHLAEFIDCVQRYKITTAMIVPVMLSALLDEPGLARADLSSLESVFYGAAPISPQRLTEALSRFGPVFTQAYGQTEAPATLTVLAKADHDPGHPRRLASCGRPVPGARVEVLGDDDCPVPAGEVGEVCARGPLVMNGYWCQPGQTAQALRGGWLRTGDLGRFDDAGYLYLVDRRKDVIITGGFNVYPSEVESALLAYPGVCQAGVVAGPDPRWGEAVTAFVAADAGLDPADLIAWVRDRHGPLLAPKRVHLVDSLPLTALGKTDRKALRAPLWEGHSRSIN